VLVRNLLKRGNLLGAGGASPGRHIRFLIPGQERRRTVDALNFEESMYQRF
jgi:hypothetical protein